MATKGKDSHLLAEHPILAKLLTEGGPDVKAYRGYVGASGREGFLAIYPSLADLGKSFEIRQSDILHVEEIPETFAPFGAIMIWVRADADVAARAVATTIGMATVNPGERIESQHGRLRMLRQSPIEAASALGEPCTSNCTCQSTCNGPCISSCRWTCHTRKV
jgi:hypothetical protein